MVCHSFFYVATQSVTLPPEEGSEGDTPAAGRLNFPLQHYV